ncbi:MAG: YdeI/OmpD-associated family protein [Ignavibacteria bacterium]|nr:YdeI/OmpD-associated family protein [Ignavibacteria bacterium]
MGKKIKEIDAYISKSQPFARPVLKHLRTLIHNACPDVKEILKWSFPHFDYKGMMCSMASFKQHCAFNFWKSSLMSDSAGFMKNRGEGGMGNFGKIKSLDDLPPDKIIISYVKEAMKLNDDDIKITTKPKVTGNKELDVPEYFLKALKKNKEAVEFFNKSSYSFKKEYVMWVTGAKTDTTREARVNTSVEWISEGKPRNWKYIKK